MSPEQVTRKYLNSKNVMQLATSRDNQPWACNIHYYANKDLNLYWISTIDRRHSLEIADNPKVAAAIKVHENTPEENYVIGIAIEGTAELMTEFDEEIAAAYGQKLNKGDEFVDDMRTGKKPYKFYKLTPQNFVVFDTKNFNGSPRQEWNPSS